jgi:hypothetical protein
VAFDPIVACLQGITDYARFERFCTDLMRFDGFVGIEPLGGVADKSRDSVLLRDGQNVIFHYSVRKDWKAKLWEDTEGVRRHSHPCTKIVCVNPAEFTTPERDSCVLEFAQEFGWPVELYGVERIASMLRTDAAPLLRKYPEIFVPDLIAENRAATVDVRINPTSEKRRQLAQIVAYNRGPGPVLIEAWYADWNGVDGLGGGHESVQCYQGRLPARLEEKAKLDILVPLDFEWERLERLGVVDAEKRRHDATEQNVKGFVITARQHMPPPRKNPDDDVSLEQVQSQQLEVEVHKDRLPGCKHDRLVIVFRNQGKLPLTAYDARIEWKFDAEKAMAAISNVAGPKVVHSSANVGLRRISQNAVSSNGSEVQFALDDSMAGILVEVITRSEDIISIEAVVRISRQFIVTEKESVRAVVVAVAQSVLDSWD